ncbi:MAG: YMGG-like glycine zipper-containing protein [Verrucomicrobiales bacterium]
MKLKLLGSMAALAVAGGLPSCETYAPNTKAGAGIGALAGAGLGAVVGHQSGHALEGAAIGAAGGAVTGAVIGSSVDDRERAYYEGPPPRRRYYQGY